jgi:hypothetical protein
MSLMTTRRPELGVEFLSWINAELRKRIEKTQEVEQTRNAGLMNRLKAYITDRLTVAV